MTAVLVLGIPRTGTSAVAGILHHLGVYMGEGWAASASYNLKGTYEDSRMKAIMEEMVGGQWTNPRPSSLTVEQSLPAWNHELQRFQDHELWGFKHSLLCFVLPFLVDTLPGDTRLIVTSRDPDATVKSIMLLPGMLGIGMATKIYWRFKVAMGWMDLGQKTIPEKWTRLLIRYEDLVARPKENVGLIADFAGICPNRAAVDFVDPALRHW